MSSAITKGIRWAEPYVGLLTHRVSTFLATLACKCSPTVILIATRGETESQHGPGASVRVQNFCISTHMWKCQEVSPSVYVVGRGIGSGR